MPRIVFRPYRGEDREERIESDAAQNALAELLAGEGGCHGEFVAIHPAITRREALGHPFCLTTGGNGIPKDLSTPILL